MAITELNSSIKVMNNICHWLGIIRTTTAACHPKGNGMCERANRSLKQALTCLLLERGTSLYKALPLALWSMRSAIHRVTGYSPYQILSARYVRTPYDSCRQCSNTDLIHVTSPSHTFAPSASKIPISSTKHQLNDLPPPNDLA
jgi:transposase InsO family protein